MTTPRAGWGWNAPILSTLAVTALAAGILYAQIGMRSVTAWLVAVNVATFSLCAADKQAARRGMWRISERSLLALAILGGSLGLLAGMLVVRHKIRKGGFIVLMASIITLQVLLMAQLFGWL